jgi:hypothetical protein
MALALVEPNASDFIAGNYVRVSFDALAPFTFFVTAQLAYVLAEKKRASKKTA